MRSIIFVGYACLASLVGCGGQSREPSDGSMGGAEGEACKAGKSSYQQRRAELVAAAEATACRTDADCGVLHESNGCVVTCGTALPASTVSDLRSQLDALATKECGSCPPLPIPPCVPPQPLTCQQGKCVN